MVSGGIGMDRVGCDVVQPGCDTEHVATFFVQTDGEKVHDVIFLDLFLQGSNLNTQHCVGFWEL